MAEKIKIGGELDPRTPEKILGDASTIKDRTWETNHGDVAQTPNQKQDEINEYFQDQIDNIVATEQGGIQTDAAPTEGSVKLVQSGGTYTTIQNAVTTAKTFLTGETVPTIGIDTNPTNNSTNLVKSGGVKAAIDNVAFSTNEKVNTVGIDDEPTAGSDNLVKSGGVAKMINNLCIAEYSVKVLSYENGNLINFGTADYKVTDYIDVSQINYIEYSLKSGDTTHCVIAAYDESKNYIQGNSIQITTAYAIMSGVWEKGTTTKYIRLAFQPTNSNTGSAFSISKQQAYYFSNIDTTPEFNSKHLVESGGVYEEISKLDQKTTEINNISPYNIEAIESSTRVKFEYKLTSVGFVIDAKSFNPIYTIAVVYFDSENTKIYDSGWLDNAKVSAPDNAVTARVIVRKNQYDTLTVDNARANTAIICSKQNNDYSPEFGFNVTEFATKYSLGQTTFNAVNLAATIIPVPYRKVGLIITYKDADGNWHKYQFAGTSLSDWSDAGSWKNGVDDRFANLYGQGTLISKRITGGQWLSGGYCYLVDMNAYRGTYLKVERHAKNQSFIAFLKSSQPLTDNYADFCDGQNMIELTDYSIHSYLIPQDCSVLYVYAGYLNETNNYPSIVQVSGVDTVASALSPILSNMANMQDSIGRISIIPCNTSVEIVAHGGVHINGIPYNSLDAVRYAGKCGFRFVETDIRITSDDKFVIMHDDTINSAMRNISDYSVISDTIYINSKTLAELKAGYVLAADDVRMRRTIPTLEEYLVECRRFDIIPIIEIKSSATTHEQLDQIVAICKKIAGDGKFCFDSFYSASLDYIRSISAKTLLFYMNASGIVNTNNSVTGQSRADGYTIWFPNYLWEIYTQENIDAHKIAGISVAVHTVPANKMNDILLNNADYIFSDSIPIAARLVGKVFSSNVDFSDFITDGTIVNQSLTLEVDDTVAVEPGSVWMGGCYLRIIANGKFSITAPNLSVNIDTDGGIKEYCFQSYIDNKDSSLLITATDNTVIQFINYCVAEIH